MEQWVVQIRRNLKAARDKQKSYADLKRTYKEFKFGDHVYLQLKPNRISLKVGSYAQLAPKVCGPFEVLDKIETMAYRISFPANMRAHNVFHVSLLKKYAHDPNHIFDWNVIQVEPEEEFQVEPMCIINQKETALWNKAIGQVKVQWKNLRPNEATWKLEEAMGEAYPFLFSFEDTEDDVVLRGRGCNTPILTLGYICLNM